MSLPAEDLDHILAHGRAAFETLRDGRIFITGGTGFFGTWLVESFAWANERLNLNASACVLTRAPEVFCARLPHLAGNAGIQFHRGDMGSFQFPAGGFTHAIHAATETRLDLDAECPSAVFESNLSGTKRVLEFVRASGAGRLLFTSSGAVYGKQPPDLTHVPEDYAGAPATTGSKSAYGESKRAAELLCALHARRYGFAATIARCFAFVGAHLPQDSGYAIGNFIRDAAAGGPIRVQGDGTPFRSYLYAADLAIWLWTILCRGESCRPYNVGSGEEIRIASLAREVAEEVNPRATIEIASTPAPGEAPQRYVPRTARAESELGLKVLIARREGIRRTAAWHRSRGEMRKSG